MASFHHCRPLPDIWGAQQAQQAHQQSLTSSSTSSPAASLYNLPPLIVPSSVEYNSPPSSPSSPSSLISPSQIVQPTTPPLSSGNLYISKRDISNTNLASGGLMNSNNNNKFSFSPVDVLSPQSNPPRQFLYNQTHGEQVQMMMPQPQSHTPPIMNLSSSSSSPSIRSESNAMPCSDDLLAHRMSIPLYAPNAFSQDLYESNNVPRTTSSTNSNVMSEDYFGSYLNSSSSTSSIASSTPPPSNMDHQQRWSAFPELFQQQQQSYPTFMDERPTYDETNNAPLINDQNQMPEISAYHVHHPSTSSSTISSNASLTSNNSNRRTVKGRKSDTRTSSISSNSSNCSNSSKKNKQTVNTELYKTELCSSFVKSGGYCPYGDKCQFAHGQEELKVVDRPSNWRSKPCQNWLKTGTCSYNERCCFRHD